MSIEIKPNDQLFVIMSVDGEDIEAVPHVRFITANKELANRKLQEFRKKVNLRNEEYEHCQECPYADCIDWDENPESLAPLCFVKEVVDPNGEYSYCRDAISGYDTDCYYIDCYLYESDRPWLSLEN